MKFSLFQLAFSNLARRRGKAFALGFGLTLTVMLVAAVLFLTDALRAESVRAENALPDVVVQRLIGGRPSVIDPNDALLLQDIDGVLQVKPRVWGYLFMPAISGNITIIGVNADAKTLENSGVLAEGNDLARGQHEVLIGKMLAESLGLRPQDSLRLPNTIPLRVAGIFESDLDLYASDVVLCDDADARLVLGLSPNQATDLAIEVANPAERSIVGETALTRLSRSNSRVRVIDKDATGRVYALAYGRRGGLVLAASIPALIALLVLAWDRGSGISPEEKREIAIMKAVGFATSDVLWTRLFESFIVSAFATALGLLAAYAWIFWLGAPGLRPALVGWSTLYPKSNLTPEIDFSQLIGIALSVIGPFIGLSILPAWRAAILDPMDTMRN